MRKYWALGAALAVSMGWPMVHAQTIPDEYAKLIQDRSRIGSLDDGLFGDRVSLSMGGLEFVQTDVALAGNDALPVRVGRRFRIGNTPARGHFSDWDLDIPHLHGTFADLAFQGGWSVDSSTPDHRCTQFGPPPTVSWQNGVFDPDEYWHGTFFYLPGSGDQELLLGGDTPSSGGPYVAVTREGAAVRCLSSLASTSESGSTGEGFEVVTPDGTIYTFDQMVSRTASALTKSEETPPLGASAASRRTQPGKQGVDVGTNAVTCCTLQRVEVLIYPTKITDRFGNYVTYTWSSSNPGRLLGIASSDGDRTITFGYSSTDPSSNLVQSVTAGTRTWSYTYGTGGNLATVTQPDLRTWQFSLSDLYQNARPSPSGVFCDTISVPTGSAWTGTITAPSGAQAEYTVAEKLFGRSWVPRDCKVSSDLSSEYVTEPYLFVDVAITGKEITGPGLPGSLAWTYAYGSPNNCWDPAGVPAGDPDAIACTSSSPVSRTTTVTAPDGATSRYTFGNRMRIDLDTAGNEGLLLEEEHGVSGSSALRSTTNTYGDGDAAPYASHHGYSIRRRGDWMIAGEFRPRLSASTVLQQGTFSWSVPACGGSPCFDTRARPTTVVRTGPGGATRTETTTYADNTSLWVLGQVAQVKCVAPTTLPAGCGASGTVMSATTYDSATALPLTTSAFGKLKNVFTYNTDGTIATVADGIGNTTSYSNWKRGIPQTVHFPATTESPSGATRTANVDGRGWITTVTDENGYTTSYGYDAMGRVTQVTYPAGEGWADTFSAFAPVSSAENGLAAGHWKQTVHTGNGYKVTLFDALWRPVLVHEYDAGASGTDRYVATAYDKAGRVADASYPLGASGAGLALTTNGAGNAQWVLSGARPAGVRTGYDALGRPTSVQQDSELGVLTTTTEYLAGFKRRTTDARGNATTAQFMAWDTPTFDLPVRIDAPEDQRTTIARDVFGKPIGITRTEATP